MWYAVIGSETAAKTVSGVIRKKIISGANLSNVCEVQVFQMII